MKIHELVVEVKVLERRLGLYEEKYGILSEDFYGSLMNGQLARYDEYNETRADFSRWKGIYETWQRRKQKYNAQIFLLKRLFKDKNDARDYNLPRLRGQGKES